ncbi:MAG TPA: hypothetical protein EYN66_06530 [Myxococcales bacterium]|nr:hypothetical protein [Myxococcales bacterium]
MKSMRPPHKSSDPEFNDGKTAQSRTVSSTWIAPGELPSTGNHAEEVSGLISLLVREEFLVSDAVPDVQEGVVDNNAPVIANSLDEVAQSLHHEAELLDLSAWDPDDEIDEITNPVTELGEDSDVSAGASILEVNDTPEHGEFSLRPIDPERRRPDDPVQAAIFDTRVRMSSITPFEVLGLEGGASLSSIRDARRRLLSKFSPERYKDAMLTAVSLNDLDAMQRHVDVCARNLVDPVKRGRIERLSSPSGSEVDLRGYFAADSLFREGLEHMREGAFKRSAVAIQQAIDENPNEPEYYTRYAQATMEGLRVDRRFNDRASDTIELQLRRALALNDSYEPALLFLARLRRKRADWSESLNLYQKVLAINPRNLEARKAVQALSQGA